jgi:CheY-like chemotaxis protein
VTGTVTGIRGLEGVWMIEAFEGRPRLGRCGRPRRGASLRRERYVRVAGAAAAVGFAGELSCGSSGSRRDSVLSGGGETPTDRTLREVKKPVGRRVLVVDDEPSMRLLCTINLSIAGFDVAEAADGAQALELATAGGFDLVLLDVMLPDMGGLDVARHLKGDERTRELPIVFLSARTDRDDLRAGFALGAIDYITKPFDPIALAARVEEILERVERQEGESYRRARLAELGE